jgi:NTP pyrophosphatase (non-canonical NTP hydrolase)
VKKESLAKIIDHFGLESQVKKLEEELGELLSEIKDLPSSGLMKDNFEFKSEIADVLVLINQITNKLDINQDIEEIMNFKILRTMDRYKIK